MLKPVLLLDVDGVLALRERAGGEFALHNVTSAAGSSHDVWLNPTHGIWLRLLHEVFDVVWTTGWQNDAPRLLEPILSIPEFPVLVFSERPQLGIRLDKLPDVTELVGDRPVAWLDDDLDTAARSWASNRAAPTLLVEPSPSLGLKAIEVSRLLLFAGNHRPRAAEIRHRSGVVLIDNGCVAMVERNRAGTTYFVLPGGGAEPGETIEEAALREALEEISLTVRILGPIAHLAFIDGDDRAIQHYFAVEATSGSIGPGSGPEFANDIDPQRGSYRPMWLPLEEISGLDVRPAAVVLAVDQGLDQLLDRPVLVEESA